MGEIWAALDLSGKEACFSAGDFSAGNIMFSTSFQMRGRDSSTLLPKLQEWLGSVNLSLDDVKRWTVGTGPGNYTGLRIVSALVSGIAFGREDMRCRGIPSAYAIASEMGLSQNEIVAVVYPLDDERVYSLGVTANDGYFSSVEAFSGSFQVSEFIERIPGIRIAALRKDASALPKDILDRATLSDGFPVSRMVFMNSCRWDRNSVRDLIYIRPAVNVAPMSVRSVEGVER